MQSLTLLSQSVLYVLLILMGLFLLIVFGWQIMVFRGRAMENADGSSLTPNWWITFPTGIVIGLVFILWTVLHFDVIYY